MPGNNSPKLHNAMWPGLVGEGPDSSRRRSSLATMLKLTPRRGSTAGNSKA